MADAFKVKSKKSGTEYYLHSRPAANGTTPLYYFGKEAKENAISALPDGYEISENPNTGLPVLKKKVA